MSDFMLSQVMGLLTRVSDDLERVNRKNDELDTLLGAIDDLSANLFATQAILCLALKNNPVKAEEAKAWITRQVGEADNAPKALQIVDLLLAQK